ncbi:hypothetical protein AAIB41_15265 [Brucella sp. BE17]|uniref:hypothetical protein n=1 Tax=Brucella sp. BE17 TaxID=3142977 RepID=UPI0031BB830C
MEKKEKAEMTPPVVTVYGAAIEADITVYDPRKDHSQNFGTIRSEALFIADVDSSRQKFAFSKQCYKIEDEMIPGYFTIVLK